MATTNEFVKSRKVRELTVTLTYSDTTSAKMFTLPENARIIGWVLNVTTAFSGGTTELDIGTSSTSNYYVDAGSLAAVGQIVPSTTVLVPGPVLSAVTGIYMNVGAGNTAGSVDVTCLFSVSVERDF